MRTAPKPLKFRVYPGRKNSLYYRVFVWPDQASMYADLRSTHSWQPCQAICLWRDCLKVARNGRMRKTAWMGEIHFHRGYLDPAVIAHEAFHAAMDWARRLKIDPTAYACDEPTCNESPDNERTAEAVEKIVHQCLRRMLRAGFFSP